MRTFFDNINDKQFRDYVEKRIRSSSRNSNYSFPSAFPILYQYRGLNEFVIRNILNGQLSVSSVGSFNDIYDSTTGVNQSFEYYKILIENELETINDKADDLGLDLPNLATEDAIKYAARNRTLQSRFYNNLGDNIGLKASCLSTDYKSILMWSHYANRNRGMCIGYDFNRASDDIKSLVFPVSYINEPLDLSDLLYIDNNEDCISTIDAAMIISSICKNKVWNYEKEWRFLFCLKDNNTYLNVNIEISPSMIILGSCFFQNFFLGSGKEYGLFNQLLPFIEEKQIPVYICKPKHKAYELDISRIDLNFTNNLLKRSLSNSTPSFQHYSAFMAEWLIENEME